MARRSALARKVGYSGARRTLRAGSRNHLLSNGRYGRAAEAAGRVTARLVPPFTPATEYDMTAAVYGLGWLLLAPAIVLLVYGGFLWIDGVPVLDMAAAAYWAEADAASLERIRAVVDSWSGPAVWDPWIVGLLRRPLAVALAAAAAVPGVPGLLLAVLFRPSWRRAASRG